MLAFCEMQILSLPGWVRKCFSVSTMSWYIFKASLRTGRLLWEKRWNLSLKSRWAISPAIQVRLSLMINRCQKLCVCYCAYLAWYLQSPFLLAELCPGDAEGEGGREPDGAVSRLFVWGALISSPSLLLSGTSRTNIGPWGCCSN